MSVPKPPGEWSENSEITKYLNILQEPLNELGHKYGFDACLCVLLNLMVDGARTNGWTKLQVQELLVNTWDGLSWMDEHGGYGK